MAEKNGLKKSLSVDLSFYLSETTSTTTFSKFYYEIKIHYKMYIWAYPSLQT
jgi:hypothetical protein